MIPMATGTGTRRNLAAMRAAGWGLVLTPDRPELREGFPVYGIDNGAWGCHQRKEPWNEQRWLDLLAPNSAAALWCVLPDVVEGGAASLDRSLWYLQEMGSVPAHWLIAVQDGMTYADLVPHVSPQVGLFVGGSTEWKEQSLPTWGRLARESGCWLHVGRVNSQRRIKLCAMAGADSFDGTSVTRFAKTLPPLDNARRQGAFLFDTEGI